MIRDFKNRKNIIAAESPTKSTIEATLQMIIYQNVKRIYMLCDTDKRSVFKYFPTLGKRMKHGDYTVTTEYEDAKSTHVVQRVLNIHIAGRDHKVILLQYTGWPQSG